MCDPMTIGAGIALAAGTALQYRAQEQREDDMRSLQRRETERQDAHYKESKQLLDRNRDTYERGNVDTNMAKASENRQAQYAAADRAAPRAREPLPGAQSGNSVVADAFARALASAAGEAKQQGAARADLASFGDFMGRAAIDNNQRSTQIGQIGSFMQGSANVLPLELQRAATRNRGSATAGNLLTAFGSAMMGGMGSNAQVGAQAAGTAAATQSPTPLFGGLY